MNNLGEKGTSALARARLEEVIERGRVQGRRVIPTVLDVVPDDEIVAASTTRFAINPGGVPFYSTPIGTQPLSDHAFAQLMGRIGIPTGFAREQLETSSEEDSKWRHASIERLVRDHLEHTNALFLVRHLGGLVRGVLSNSFRRLDCRPMLLAFLEVVNELGGVPVDARLTETRLVVRVVIPEVFEPSPGEYVVYGLELSNSDFGAGEYQISIFVLRLVCLNGMTAEKELSKRHLGSRLSMDLKYSRETYDLDQATLVSATRDTVRRLLTPDALTKRSAEIARLTASELPFAAALPLVQKNLLKAEKEALRDCYEGPDRLNLPSGQHLWRFANAISWLANDEQLVKNEDRRIELQQMAGRLLKLS